MYFFLLRLWIFSCCWLFASSLLEAQPTFNLRKTFGYPACVLTSVHPTDSCYYVTGIIADTIWPHETGNIFAQLDLEGNLNWMKTLTSQEKTYETWFNTLLPLEDGGFANVGYTFHSSNMHALFIRYDQNGDTLFTTEYINPLTPEETFFLARGFTKDDQGNFYVALEAAAPNVGIYQNSDYYVLKLDSLGQKVWGKFYGGDDWELPFSILINQDEEIVVGGVRTDQNLKNANYSRRIYLLGLDSLGNFLWSGFSPDSVLQLGAMEMVELQDGSLGMASGDGTEGVDGFGK